MATHLKSVKEGEFTNLIYTMIKEQRFREAISIFNDKAGQVLMSRALLSLLGYCYFNMQDYVKAAACYEKLFKLCPKEYNYRLYYVQSLYQASLYDKAAAAASSIDNPAYSKEASKLIAGIKYGEDNIVTARALLENLSEKDPDYIVNQACLLYKENRFSEALQKFITALTREGLNPHLSYNVALCFFKLKDYTAASKHIADIVDHGIREHPELSIGLATEGIGVRSVGNSLILHESALIEAFNLKAAIEYDINNIEAAVEALTDMPPRAEEELDAVTLHNHAIVYMYKKPAEAFEKLQFLLQQSQYPPETLPNLLLLYCKYGYYNLAADLLAENSHLTNNLSQYLLEFIDALITQQSEPLEAFMMFEEIIKRYSESLRRASKRVQSARYKNDNVATKQAVKDFEEILECYLPIHMSQAKIFFDFQRYDLVETLFRKAIEFCKENETWQMHVAHNFFIQENKYKEAIAFYEPLHKKYFHGLLHISPILVANLCVSYIMTGLNDQAEELMRKIESEEEKIFYVDPTKKIYHLSIVNLVIGTLYCAKGNFEFGINRLIRSLEPYNKKLGSETWFYAKTSILALIENIAKQTVVLSDSFYNECVDFLEQCEIHGSEIKVVVPPPLHVPSVLDGKNTISYEARLLKSLLIRTQNSR